MFTTQQALAQGKAGPTPRQRKRALNLAALRTQARKLKLAQDPLWLKLLHYRKGTFGGYTSEADATSFFLTKDGKGNPEAELDATLKAVAQPSAPTGTPPMVAECRFPARAQFIRSRLGISDAQAPRPKCKRFEKFKKSVQAESLTIVFSSYYLNNPASAFGHTFLRINRATKGGGKRHELLDAGIDYSAAVDTNNSLIYAIKGLAGMFPGTFRHVPYYLKVREYNDFESRDLWEYRLNLSRAQKTRVVAHLWELGSTYFDYFYLTENCSYHVLGALDVANPRWNLAERQSWPVIPSDTVRTLMKVPGLVNKITYRPSGRTRFENVKAALTPEEQTWVKTLAKDPSAPFPTSFGAAQKRRVVDAALDYFDVLYAKEIAKPRERMNQAAMAIKQSLLRRRAGLGVAGDEEELRFAPPFRKMPHLGHDSSRVGLGHGYDKHRGLHHELSFRLALHDLADASAGYPETATLEFLPLKARLYAENTKFQIESLHLVKIASYSPIGGFETPLSWDVNFGAERLRDSECSDCLSTTAQVSGGYSVGSGDGVLLWGLASAQTWLAANGGIWDYWRIGAGPKVGTRLAFHDRFHAVAQGKLTVLPGQKPLLLWNATAALRWGIQDNWALGAEGAVQPEGLNGQLTSFLYF